MLIHLRLFLFILVLRRLGRNRVAVVCVCMCPRALSASVCLSVCLCVGGRCLITRCFKAGFYCCRYYCQGIFGCPLLFAVSWFCLVTHSRDSASGCLCVSMHLHMFCVTAGQRDVNRKQYGYFDFIFISHSNLGGIFDISF